jgi:hypothetical protein
VQIVISPKVRKVILITLAAALLIIGLLALRPWFIPQLEEATATGLPADAQAAVNAAKAFYTLDYSEDIDLWATRLCAYSTDAGCRAVQDYFAPAVQAMVQENQVRSGCTVEPVRLIADKGDIHIWHVTVSMDNPWPGLDAPVQDVFVEVEKVGGRWLMNRILFEQETEQLITPTP